MPIASARPKVLIVGGGISGSAVAYELAQRGATSIVAEREPTLASHASGRSAAQWGPDEGGPVAIAAGPIFDRWSRELRSPGFFTPRPTLFVDTDEVDEIDKLLTRYARGRSMILTPHERRWTGAAPEVLEVSPEAAVHLFPLLDSRKIRRAALDRRDMDIDSHRIVRVLAKGVRQLGGQIRVNAPVTDVVKRGSSWLVQAGDDTVTCDMVVNAAGAWADQISELAGVSIQGVRPLRRSTFLARLPHLMRPHRQTPLLVWGKSGAYVRWAPEADLYGSPADVEPSPPGDPRPNDDAIEQALRSLAAITRLPVLQTHIRRACLRVFGPDHRPLVGVSPADPSFGYLIGLGGTGVQCSAWYAQALAAQLCGEPVPREQSAADARLGISLAEFAPKY